MSIVTGYLDGAIAEARAMNEHLRAAVAAARRMRRRARKPGREAPQLPDTREQRTVFLPGDDQANPGFGGGSGPGH